MILRHMAAAAILLGGALLAPCDAWGLTPVILVDGDLEQYEATLQSLHQGVITYFGPERNLRTESARKFLQLRPRAVVARAGEMEGGSLPISSDAVTLSLIDGQVLTGVLTSPPQGEEAGDAAAAGTTDQAGQVLWLRHRQLGHCRVPLERLAGFSVGAASLTDMATVPAGDEVTMSNGDRIGGFITAMTAQAVSLAMDGQETPIQLELPMIRSVRLANPRIGFAADIAMVHLQDGDRVAGRDLMVWDDRASMQPLLTTAKEPLQVPLSRVRRIDLPGSGERLIDATTLTWRVTEGGEVFGVAMGPAPDGGAMALHAPVTIELLLPPGAQRFAATARLDRNPTGGVAAVEGWADMNLVLRSGGKVIWQSSISDAVPMARINVAIPAGDLSVVLDPAANGPILDRLRLDDAVVLLAPTATSLPAE